MPSQRIEMSRILFHKHRYIHTLILPTFLKEFSVLSISATSQGVRPLAAWESHSYVEYHLKCLRTTSTTGSHLSLPSPQERGTQQEKGRLRSSVPSFTVVDTEAKNVESK